MTKNKIKFILTFFLAAIIIASIYLDKSFFINLFEYIQRLNGMQAILLFSMTYILSNLLLLPFGLPLNLLSGMLWGAISGGLLINFLSILAASLSFFMGRWFANYFFNDLFKKNTYLTNAKNQFNRHDWQFISLARINPIVPFGLSNYLFGIIPELSFWHYIFVTAIANLIPCLVFASIGSLLKTFTLPDCNIKNLIIETGIAILLITALYTIKVLIPITSSNKNYTKRKLYENNLMRDDTKRN